MGNVQGIQQSIPICIALSAAGGILEVFATALLAYADAKDKAGETFSPCRQYLALAGNVVLQILASIVGNLFAPWFGPVSLVGPFFLSAQLLANMIVYGFFLGLEAFTKDMKVGTYVIVVAAAILPEVGPSVQHDQDIMQLIGQWYALVWSALLVFGMFVSCLFLVIGVAKLRHTCRYVVLLLARSTAFTVNLTVSKIMVSNPSLAFLIVSIVLKVLSGGVMTYAIVVQSTAVSQATFVPLNASSIMLVNALTGIIIWEDGKVVQSWLGYAGIFVLMVLGNFLLLGEGALFDPENERYGRGAVLSRMAGKRDLLADMRHSMESLASMHKSMSMSMPEDDEEETVLQNSPVSIREESVGGGSAEEGGGFHEEELEEGSLQRPQRPNLVRRVGLKRSPSKTLRRSFNRIVWEDVCGVDDEFIAQGGSVRRHHIFRTDDTTNGGRNNHAGMTSREVLCHTSTPQVSVNNLGETEAIHRTTSHGIMSTHSKTEVVRMSVDEEDEEEGNSRGALTVPEEVGQSDIQTVTTAPVALPSDCLDRHVLSSVAGRKPRWKRNDVHGKR